MANAKPVKTPLGTFASAAQAARAHHCDRSTILNRINIDPDNYQLVVPSQRRGQPPVPISAGWSHYRSLTDDQKDAWYDSWCRSAGFDPNSDEGGDAFFAALDAVQDTENETA